MFYWSSNLSNWSWRHFLIIKMMLVLPIWSWANFKWRARIIYISLCIYLFRLGSASRIKFSNIWELYFRPTRVNFHQCELITSILRSLLIDLFIIWFKFFARVPVMNTVLDDHFLRNIICFVLFGFLNYLLPIIRKNIELWL